jgi:hypothetical protein
MQHGFTTIDLANELSRVRREQVREALAADLVSHRSLRRAVGRRLVQAGFRLIGTPVDRPLSSVRLFGT